MTRAICSVVIATLTLLPGAFAESALPAETPVDEAKITKYLEAGSRALQNGKYEHAIREYEKANKAAGGNSTAACLGLATANVHLERFDDAIVVAEKALSTASDPYQKGLAHNILGSAIWRKYPLTLPWDRESQLARAETAFREALALTQGDLSVAWSNLGLVLEEQGKIEESFQALEQYLERVPTDESAMAHLNQLREQFDWLEASQRSERLAREHRLDDAVAVVREFQESYPEYDEAGDRVCWLQYVASQAGEFRQSPERTAAETPGTHDAEEDSPMKVVGDVVPPKKLHTPQPTYTETARLARVDGVVILEAVIDNQGHPTNIKVIEGLPMGLTESAVRSVCEWRFKPATLHGEPVAVYFNVTTRFSLQ